MSGKRSRHEDDAAAYYDRLVHTCRKALHKQAKVAKSFECQKLIRQIKETANAKREHRLERLKQLSLDPVVDECFKRLGIKEKTKGGERDGQDGATPSKTAEPKSKEQRKADEKQAKLVERILAHKRMRDCLEEWSAEVTKYHRWCAREEERGERPAKKHRRPDDNKSRGYDKAAIQATEDLSKSLFMQLGDDEDQNSKEEKKKNRPGQRARKAKAAAIQAKKEGRAIDQSLNWRAKKESDRDRLVEERPNQTTRSKPEPKSNESLHPSWEAQKSKKEGIVAFQGKKITFD